MSWEKIRHLADAVTAACFVSAMVKLMSNLQDICFCFADTRRDWGGGDTYICTWSLHRSFLVKDHVRCILRAGGIHDHGRDMEPFAVHSLLTDLFPNSSFSMFPKAVW